MKSIQLLVISIFAISIVSCASPAQRQNMYVKEKEVNLTFDEQLTNSIEVEQVGGGKETNPMWTSQISNQDFQAALEHTLKEFYLLSKSTNKANVKYDLVVTLVDLDQPMFGLDLKVETKIRYMLIERASKAIMFDKTVEAEHVATIGDAFSAVQRLRLANEGSAKQNIKQFIEELSGLKISSDEIALK